MDLELDGRRALVSGGSRGIGKAVARRLVAEGAAVAVAARNRSDLEQAAADIAAAVAAPVAYAVGDTATDEGAATIVRDAEAALGGGIDLLVNCAARPGALLSRGLDGLTAGELADEVNTKVMGYARLAQLVVPHMLTTGWGRIVNVSGLAALRTGSVIGSIRNSAVIALTKNLADECGPAGINATAVLPGATVTERDRGADAVAAPGNLLGRMVTAAEVANVVAFLASPLGVAINGEAVICGGGVPEAIRY